MAFTQIKPTHKAILAYYSELKGYGDQGISHEGAVSTAFQNLLAATGNEKKWTLIPQFSLKIGGKTVRPDGTFRDEWHLPRGYWEAKDTSDDLDAEIRKKMAKGYPLSNTIFEDTQTAVLFQNGQEARRVSLTEPAQVADLLTDFYRYTTPDYEGFNEAVAAFKERIPDLAKGLKAKIEAAHKKNKKFIAAFEAFFELCQTSLNPNIRVEAVDEMLVQHLLTERLFRTIFQNADFTRRNVIAAEIEQVIDALTSGSFSRAEFLKSLDTFYLAIEGAAATIQDFSQKQHFLNTVYERFFQGYSVKVADTHGIVYTPQEIVDFMWASVEEVLRTEFGKGLGDEGVTILDPCTGTGNFIVNLMRRIPKKDLPRAYKEQLFANEVMLLPYYIAAMNIEHEYYELTGGYEPFEGLCFVDTLELAEGEQRQLSFMSEKNTERVERQKRTPITVVIGNPPYNAHQADENDNNRNRKYKVLDERVRGTFSKDSSATNKSALSDVLIKFYRWASDRIGEEGVIAFVSNNAFIEGFSFDGMRKHLEKDFDQILLLDLKGNVRKDSMREGKRVGEQHAIFDLGAQVGISVNVFVRSKKARRGVFLGEVDWRITRPEKFAILHDAKTIQNASLRPIETDGSGNWHIADNAADFMRLISIGNKQTKSSEDKNPEVVFKSYSRGVATSRDSVVYDFDPNILKERIIDFIETYNVEVDRYRRSDHSLEPDDFVDYTKLKWSRDLKKHLKNGINTSYNPKHNRVSRCRPFCTMNLYFDSILNEEVYVFPHYFPSDEPNQVIAVSDVAYRSGVFNVLISDKIIDLHLCYSADSHQAFPYYTYDEDGSNRRENITDWALNQFRDHYQDPEITKWDIFHYVYGVLHQPEYRSTFADNLKRELPRIPFMDDFRAFADAGRALAKWHLEYESVEPWPLTWVDAPGVPLSYEVVKMKLSKDKTTLVVNDSLTLADIPPEVSRYRLGNRSALEWVVDQYQVSEDPRSGIRSDPNRLDDPEYIVRLVGQVVRVSVETVKIVEALPGGLGVGLNPA